jgi:hypothetical protein
MVEPTVAGSDGVSSSLCRSRCVAANEACAGECEGTTPEAMECRSACNASYQACVDACEPDAPSRADVIQDIEQTLEEE